MALCTQVTSPLAPLTVGIVGIGRVGLPFALALADAGCRVIGVDRDTDLVRRLLAGQMPFMEDGAEELLQRHIGDLFRPYLSFEPLAAADAIVLTPGTPVDENMNPVLEDLEQCVESLLPLLRRGQTVILRSTVSPGTTEYVRKLIESGTSLRVGHDVFLAHCPERIAQGRALRELRTFPQIVGAEDDESARRAIEVFDRLGVRSLRTDQLSAELAKLFSNMYRYINFAIANEFMLIAESYGRDAYHVTDLVNRDYVRGGLASPGFTAGPCLYKDGFFLINHLPFSDLITTSWRINESMPLALVARIAQLRDLTGAKVALLGMAFKADIDDVRESLSFKVRKAFARERAVVHAHDPYAPDFIAPLRDVLSDADVVFIAQRHRPYRGPELREALAVAKPSATVCDLWNVLETDRVIFSLSELGAPRRQAAPVVAGGSSNDDVATGH